MLPPSSALDFRVRKMHAQTSAKAEIILVEDREEDIAFTESVLKKANVFNKVHVLRKGSELMDFLARQGPFASEPGHAANVLILLSLALSDINAVDLLRKLKLDERTKSLPVVILTPSQQARGVMDCYKLGANACILKPMDLSKFVEAVSESRLGWLLVTGGGDKL